MAVILNSNLYFPNLEPKTDRSCHHGWASNFLLLWAYNFGVISTFISILCQWRFIWLYQKRYYKGNQSLQHRECSAGEWAMVWRQRSGLLGSIWIQKDSYFRYCWKVNAGNTYLILKLIIGPSLYTCVMADAPKNWVELMITHRWTAIPKTQVVSWATDRHQVITTQ